MNLVNSKLALVCLHSSFGSIVIPTTFRPICQHGTSTDRGKHHFVHGLAILICEYQFHVIQKPTQESVFRKSSETPYNDTRYTEAVVASKSVVQDQDGSTIDAGLLSDALSVSVRRSCVLLNANFTL